MSSQLQLASIMVPANQDYWWYYGQTAEQVGQLLTQNKAMLTSIDAYVDTDNTLKFAVVMAPASQSWWWYYGQTGEQVGQLLAQNKAMLTDISVYVDTDNTLKFAIVMAPANQTWWWGQTGEQVGQLLTQNKAMLTRIDAYIDIDTTVKFAVVMAPANQTWWWYYGSPAFIGQQLTQNKARLTAVSSYLWSTTASVTVNTYPNISGLNGAANLTIQQSGAYSFSGGWSPSNVLIGLASQNVSYCLAIRDNIRGKVFTFSTSGNVPIEGSYNFNDNSTNVSLAANWQFLSAGYTWHDNYSASLDLGSTLQGLVNWFEQNEQTISEVVQVVGDVAIALS